jgi:ABC-type Zn uptake system ZnuABC Zn-binding protein ZnuA
LLRTILNTNTARFAGAAAAVLSLSVLTGCGDDPAGEAEGPTVVAGTTQIADLARNVAGDRAEVVGILGPGSDPHEYEPRPSDAEALTEASLVLRSGGDVDLWLDQLVESSGTDGEVVDLLEAVETIPGGDDGEADPHWWQSPANAARAVDAIRDALIEADPEGRAHYERNARRYGERLTALDREIAACIERIPADRRKLVTSHDSLAYFAERYGIEIVGSTIPALTTQAQPSAGETAELVELIESERVAAVFGEVGVSESLEQAVAEETGAALGGELYADSLGPADSAAGTLIGAAAANAEAIAAGLGGGLECGIEA